MNQAESSRYYQNNAPLSAYTQQIRQPIFTPATRNPYHIPKHTLSRADADWNGHLYAPEPKPERRIFLWVFLAIQAIFMLWIVAGSFSHPAGPTAAQQAAQQCANGGWHYIFKSQADCVQHYGHALNDAGNVGKGIGIALIIALWVVVDVILGIGYAVYRWSRR